LKSSIFQKSSSKIPYEKFSNIKKISHFLQISSKRSKKAIFTGRKKTLASEVFWKKIIFRDILKGMRITRKNKRE